MDKIIASSQFHAHVGWRPQSVNAILLVQTLAMTKQPNVSNGSATIGKEQPTDQSARSNQRSLTGQRQPVGESVASPASCRSALGMFSAGGPRQQSPDT